MNFAMIGVDYKSVPIDIREKISFTKSKTSYELSHIKEVYKVGVVIVSTCNRTEIYIASENFISDETIMNLYNEAIGLKVPFYMKRGKELIDYLFELACGLHSMILGEDQIITQINESVELSIECGTGNSAINTLFRHSVTCAKKAKTQVNIKFVSPSIVSKAVDIAKKEIPNLCDMRVLVIGNGEMGKLSAELLEKETKKVYMTLRTYKYKVAEVPQNCEAVNYENRMSMFEKVDIVISGTKSPHYTVTYENFAKLENKPKYIFDLAVPRDIEPKIREIVGINCFDVDDIGKDSSHYDENAIQQIYSIIEEQKIKFDAWLEFYNKIN